MEGFGGVEQPIEDLAHLLGRRPGPERREIALYRAFPEAYGYVFYLMRRGD